MMRTGCQRSALGNLAREAVLVGIDVLVHEGAEARFQFTDTVGKLKQHTASLLDRALAFYAQVVRDYVAIDVPVEIDHVSLLGFD